jgi:hypothetical protein
VPLEALGIVGGKFAALVEDDAMEGESGVEEAEDDAGATDEEDGAAAAAAAGARAGKHAPVGLSSHGGVAKGGRGRAKGKGGGSGGGSRPPQ